MTYAAITGWGKCLPPAVVTNDDLATFLDTSDEWITTRTGMKERRISHVTPSELGYVASERAIAAAGLDASEIDLIIMATCTPDTGLPNCASYIQKKLGAVNAGSMDLNSACTGFMYSLSTATSMIKTGVIRKAIVVGADVMSQSVPWMDRSISVLFGDGAAAWVLEATEEKQGILSQRMGCMADDRDILAIAYGFTAPGDPRKDLCEWNFQGQDIFKRAVNAMAEASEEAIEMAGISKSDIDLCVPHQANKRIIDAVAKKAGIPTEKCYVNVHRYANVSAATIPVAMTEALEEHRVEPYDTILMPAFGGGLTWSSHVVKWGQRTTPLGHSDVELPPCDKTGLELIQMLMDGRAEKYGHSSAKISS